MELQIPKIHFYFTIKKLRKHRMYLSPIKARFFLSVEAKYLLNLAKKMTIRIVYSKDSQNQGTYDNFNDLKQMFEAFMDKSLWHKKT